MNNFIRQMGFALLSALAATVALQAQAPPGAAQKKIFTKRMAFKLPLKIAETEQAQLREVQLYVKTGPNGPWTYKESAPPSQGDFTYRVPQDGEYWFSVVTVDKTGNKTPADVSKEQPGVVVVVDSQGPEVEVHPIAMPSGDTLLQCVVRDVNLDSSKVKVEGQSTDKTWVTLDAVPNQPGLYRLPSGQFAGLVRATATDRAGNTTNREVNVMASLPAGPSEITQVSYTAPAPSYPVQPRLETMPSTPVREPVPGLRLLNSTHASLDYQIDQKNMTGTDKVEVWFTCDDGLTWHLLGDDADRTSPVEFDLPGEGMYGLGLVVSTGSGSGSQPPAKGEGPVAVVEVDVTKPVAQLMSIRPASESNSGTYVITWSASDKNLKAEPIDLYYATKKEGPWLTIVKNLKNDGSYHWLLPPGQGPEYFVRMEVSDRAGNMTRCDALQPVVSPFARAKPRFVDITVAPSSAPPPSTLVPLGH